MAKCSKRAPARSFATALELAQHLAARWFELSVNDAGKLVVQPARWITDADRAAIRQHRDALIALVQSTPEASCPRLRFFRFEAFADCASTRWCSDGAEGHGDQPDGDR